MGCVWVNAGYDKKFVLTELGGENPRIRDKFEEKYSNKAQYEACVPKKWVENGYVREVDK